jgi:hypothetical protein
MHCSILARHANGEKFIAVSGKSDRTHSLTKDKSRVILVGDL